MINVEVIFAKEAFMSSWLELNIIHVFSILFIILQKLDHRQERFLSSNDTLNEKEKVFWTSYSVHEVHNSLNNRNQLEYISSEDIGGTRIVN